MSVDVVPGGSLPPIFIKASLKMKVLEFELAYEAVPISLYGAAGLKTTQFNPLEAVGTDLTVSVEAHSFPPFPFDTPARLTAELTQTHSYVGVKFALADAVRDQLAEAIRKSGHFPTEYARKYPRIPAEGVIPSMPLHVILFSETGDLVVCDIANMSPGGILLYSENPKAELFPPGMRLEGQLEPRGAGSPGGFEFEATVCRVVLDFDPMTHNTKRFLGLRFGKIAEEHKKHFLDTLKLVLIAIQDAGLVDRQKS